jgi:carboxypeptidase Taq
MGDRNSDMMLLRKIDAELSSLGAISSLLRYDAETIMPKAAIEERAVHTSYIDRKYHELRTSKVLQQCVAKLSQKEMFAKLSLVDQKIVARHKKKLLRYLNVPPEFVEELSRARTLAGSAWERAREKNNFKVFMPHLKKLVELKKKEAKLIDPHEHPYNVLLDDFEEGMTISELDVFFPELKVGIIEILENVQHSKVYKEKTKEKTKHFVLERDDEKKIVQDIMERILPEKKRYLLGSSIHPFSTIISPNDVRITTAYRKDQPFFSFTSVTHEAGHALYDLGMGKKLADTILFDAPSYGMHESQSRFWENHVTKSENFWEYYYPIYKRLCKSKIPTKQQLFREINKVSPSLIRIESDEVTYALHIIIRYEIERLLLEGKISVEDLPKEWNARYKKYLGITPKSDKEGVLQDVHWSDALFGYFPTYALGTMYAAMLYAAMQKDIDCDRKIRTGKFGDLREWLRVHVHEYGAMYSAEEIITKACHTHPSPKFLIGYLKEKYYPIYHVRVE